MMSGNPQDYNNVWKLYKLLESVISDKGSQFAADLTRELNQMLDI